jgi:methyl-accepting chemotaxis protein
MIKWIIRASVRTQVTVLGALGIIGLLILAGVYLRAYEIQEQFAVERDRADQINDHIVRIDHDLLEARRAEKDFLLRSDEAYVEKQIKNVNSAAARALELRELVQGMGATLAASADALIPGINTYRSRFQAVAEQRRRIGLDQDHGLLGSLRQSVHAVEAALKQVEQPRLQILMLMMRRHEKDFLARGETRYIDEFRKRTDEFRNVLVAAPDIPADLATKVHADMGSYERDFLALADAQLTVAQQLKLVSASYAELEPHLQAAQEAAKRLLDDAKAAEVAVDHSSAALMWWVFGIASGGVLLLSFLIGGAINRSLRQLALATQRLAENDLSAEVPGADRRGELGLLARAIEVLKAGLVDRQRLQVQQVEMRLNLAKQFEQDVGEIVATTVGAADELKVTAGHLNATADTTNRQMNEATAAVQQASANVQTVAVATEELSASIAEISRQVAQSTAVASEAFSRAEKSNTLMASLTDGARKVGDVVGLISDIAGQTDLLALNATIEAARVGEAGKGFTVVAGEVKQLALQTTRATEEIQAHVNSIQEAVREAIGTISVIGGSVTQMYDTSKSIATAIRQQDAATAEIARSASEVARGIAAITQNVAAASTGANDTGTAAALVLQGSGDLASRAASLRSQIGSFLQTIRAA